MFIGLHVEYLIFLSTVSEIEFEYSRQMFERYSNIKFQ